MSFFWPIAAGATLFSMLGAGGKDEGEEAQSELTDVQKQLAQLMLEQYQSRFANEEQYMPEALKTTFDYTRNTLNRPRNVVWGKGIFEPTLQPRQTYDIKTPDWQTFTSSDPAPVVPPPPDTPTDPVVPPPSNPPGGPPVLGPPDGPLPPTADPGIPPLGPPVGGPPTFAPFNPGLFDEFFKYVDLWNTPGTPTVPGVTDAAPPFPNPFLTQGPGGEGIANVGREQFPFTNPFLTQGPGGEGIANVGREQFPFTNPFGTQGPGGEGIANVGREQFLFTSPLDGRDMGNGLPNIGSEVSPPFVNPFATQGPGGEGLANVGMEQFPFANPFGTQGPGGEGIANVGMAQFPFKNPFLTQGPGGEGLANVGMEQFPWVAPDFTGRGESGGLKNTLKDDVTGIRVPTLSPQDAAKLYGVQDQGAMPPVTAAPPGNTDPLSDLIIFYHGQGKSIAEINRLTGVSIPEITSALGLPSMPASNTLVRGNILGG